MNEFAPLLFRIASWPMDTVDGLRSPEFTTEVDAAIAQEKAIRASSEDLSAVLYSAIPGMAPEARRVALRVRRALHRGAEPISAEDLNAMPDDAGIHARLMADDRERRCLRERIESLRFRYEGALEAELRELSVIAHQPEFRRAVAVASPGASDALEQLVRNGELPATWRLRTTLLNYAMRAMGRATPNGFWAGVAMESRHEGGEPISVRDSGARIFAKPDLNAFFELFELAASAHYYRDAVYIRLNPTLSAIEAGQYVYAHFHEGTWVFARTADDGHMTRIQAAFEDSERLLFHDLAAKSGVSEEALCRLYVSGVLCATCDAEGVHEEPYAALEALIECLAPGERNVWQTAICSIRHLCSRLEACGDALDVRHLKSAIADARRIVNDLRARYGAEPYAADRGVLVFDRIAPFEIGISDELRNQIARTLRACWDFDRGGMGESLARSARGAQGASTQGDVPLALAGIEIEREERASKPDADRCTDILRAWTRELEDGYDAQVHHVRMPPPNESAPMSPGAALVVPGWMPDGLQLRIGSIAPDWGAFYGRFHHLFARVGKLEFRNWLQQARAFAENEGPVLADIAVRGAHDRNAALRPRVCGKVLDPFLMPLSGLTAHVDCERGVELRDEDRRLFPVLHSAVETLRADPWSRWFAEAEANTGRPSLLAPQPPLTHEVQTWKHCPRLMLGSGAAIGPERWWSPDGAAAELRERQSFDRYVAWRRWARSAGIPDRVYAQFGATETETLLLVDSVLAVEVLGRALSKTASPLRLQEVFFGEQGLWLEDSRGRKYVAEMAAAWRGDAEFWSR